MTPKPTALRAADVKIGTTVEHDGHDWTVWSKGPDHPKGSWWLVRTDKDGRHHQKAVLPKEMRRPERLSGHG